MTKYIIGAVAGALLVLGVYAGASTAFAYGSYYSSPSYNAVNTALTMQAQQQRQEEQPRYKNISRGTMTPHEYVEHVLVSNGFTYEEILALIPKGFDGAIINSSGQIIATKKYDWNTMTHL